MFVQEGLYVNLAKKEADPIALAFLNQGYHVAVVRYRTYLKDRKTVNSRAHFLGAVHDLMETLRLIHVHQEDWSIANEKVILCGFSAGGHLVGYLAEHWDDNKVLTKYYPELPAQIFKPSAVILSYTPTELKSVKVQKNGIISEIYQQLLQMISECSMDELNLIKHVRSDMSPVFLWQSSEDKIVSIQTTVNFYQALLAKQIPCEAHFYQKGIHGVGLATNSYAKYPQDISEQLQTWFPMACQWLKEQSFL
ncbi:MAG: alpha/beta hydrolase [Ligilactobacillus salivarius]|nr:alpha/beta hydrolase [Ligilactobacillus salivarius]